MSSFDKNKRTRNARIMKARKEASVAALRSRTSCAGLRGVARCLTACHSANPVECKEVWRFVCPEFIVQVRRRCPLISKIRSLKLSGATYDQQAALSAWSGQVISGSGCVSHIHGTRGNIWRDPKFVVAVCWNLVSSASKATENRAACVMFVVCTIFIFITETSYSRKYSDFLTPRI